jgi:tetratricopeptide (TPR) repeat protein
MLALSSAGCGSDQIEANNQMVKQQQQQIEENERESAALEANGTQAYTPGTSSHSASGCDKAVEATATQRGGERFAAGDFSKALGYYQDALTACPTDDQAEVNVARTYEALGDKPSAIAHYRKAAVANGMTVSHAQEQSKAALKRLQASVLP